MEYSTKGGMYHFHEDVKKADGADGYPPGARGKVVHSHAKVAFAYHLGSGRLITHGTPESMAAWADEHHAAGGDRMAVIAFDGVGADEVNAAIADHAAWEALRSKLGVPAPADADGSEA